MFTVADIVVQSELRNVVSKSLGRAVPSSNLAPQHGPCT